MTNLRSLDLARYENNNNKETFYCIYYCMHRLHLKVQITIHITVQKIIFLGIYLNMV